MYALFKLSNYDGYHDEHLVAIFTEYGPAVDFGEKHFPREDGSVEDTFRIEAVLVDPHTDATSATRYIATWPGAWPLGGHTWSLLSANGGKNYTIEAREVTTYKDGITFNQDAMEDTYRPAHVSVLQGYGISAIAPVLMGSKEFVDAHIDEAVASIVTASHDPKIAEFHLLEANGGYSNFMSPTQDKLTYRVYVVPRSLRNHNTVDFIEGQDHKAVLNGKLITVKVLKVSNTPRLSQKKNSIDQYTYLFAVDGTLCTDLPFGIRIYIPPASE